MHKTLTTLLFLSLAIPSRAQDDQSGGLGKQIFLPSIEIGYLSNSADALGGGILVKTSIEYRVRNNNDIFFRASFDTSDAEYTLDGDNSVTNVIKGTAAFSDLLIGGGYRFGDKKFRQFILLQAGVKRYNFPQFVAQGGTILIEQGKNSVLNTRITLGFEYYITPKSAVSVDLLQGQVWKEQDFWVDSGSAYGFSVGFITSLYW